MTASRAPDGVLPRVGNTVEIEEATYSHTIGAAALEAFWQDPDFDPLERAFYYVRVLEPDPLRVVSASGP